MRCYAMPCHASHAMRYGWAWVRCIDTCKPSLSSMKPPGFVWDKSGHIVTNLHVVRGSGSVQVSDGTAELGCWIAGDGMCASAAVAPSPTSHVIVCAGDGDAS